MIFAEVMRMSVPQGDLSLLGTDLARELLQSRIPARLAYVWPDGTPRVVPIWFHWTGEELVFGSPANAPKTKVLTDNSHGAVTIDTEGDPTRVLLLRGPMSVEIQNGVVAEYAAAARRYLGEDAGAAWVKGIEQQGGQMARIALRPTWAGLLDFEKRLPSAIGGVLE